MVDSVSASNDNKRSPLGKELGAAAGAAWGGYQVYKDHKNLKERDAFIATDEGKALSECNSFAELKSKIDASKISNGLKKMFNRQINILTKLGGDTPENVKQLVRSTVTAKGRTPIMVAAIAIMTLLGLGVGAIVDHFRNKDKD